MFIRCGQTLLALLLALALGCSGDVPTKLVSEYFHDPSLKLEFTETEKSLTREIRTTIKRKRLSVLELDHEVSAAARNLALVNYNLREKKILRIRNETMQQALWDAGVSDSKMYAHLSTSRLKSDLFARLTESIESNIQEGDYTHFGVGVVGGGFPPYRVAVVLFTKRIVELSLFPKFLEAHNALNLMGNLSRDVQNMTILVTNPSGKITQHNPLLDNNGDFLSALPFQEDQKGRYFIEVEVEGASGPEVSALFPVDYQKRPLPETIMRSTTHLKKVGGVLEEKEPILDEFQAEQKMIELINQERLDRGLIPLMEHDDLQALARSHSKDMQDNGFVAHVSPTNGELTQRAKSAGIDFIRIGENIAVNTSIRSAHRSLMESPAHRGNILEPGFRYIGVGVKQGTLKGKQIHYWITMHFADLQ